MTKPPEAASQTGAGVKAASATGNSDTALIRHRNFLLFASGQTVSKLGNAMYTVALAWTVYSLTGSTVAMGSILAVNAVPELALVLLGGTIADRVPRRTVILCADSFAAVVLACLTLASWTGQLSLPLLFVAAFLLGIVTAFYGPAYSAMNRDLLPSNQLQAANALFAVSKNTAQIIGPAAAGFIYAVAGATTVFGLDSASFIVAVLTLLFVKLPALTAKMQVKQGLISDVAQGIRYTFSVPWLRLVLALSLITNFVCLAPFLVLLPAVVKSQHHGVSLLGGLTSAQVVATIIGAVIIGRLGRRRIQPGPALAALASLIAIGVILIGAVPQVSGVLFIAVILIGAGLSFDVIENTLLQLLVPQQILSRVYSVNVLISYALLPLGYASAGILAHLIGVRSVFIAGGIMLIIICIVAAASRALRDIGGIDE
jgi:MFS family permease